MSTDIIYLVIALVIYGSSFANMIWKIYTDGEDKDFSIIYFGILTFVIGLSLPAIIEAW